MSVDGKRVGFIGLGEMGLPMARNLIKAGFEVAGYDVRPERGRELASAGGRAAGSAKEAAADAGAVVLIPFDAGQIRDSLLTPDGALESLRSCGLVLAMSTIGPAAMRDLAGSITARGFEIVDAPVTGGVARAEAGTLTVIAAGSPQALDRSQPLLSPMCGTIYRVGPQAGDAQFVKLINQLLVGTHLVATAEAMAMGAAAGVDLHQLYEILTNAFGRSEVLASRVPTVLDGSLRTGGNLSIYFKDLTLALETGRELGVPLFAGAAAFEVVQLARTFGLANQDDAALIHMLMEAAGGRAQGR